MKVDAVRGELTAALEREVLDHWATHTLLRGGAARQRLEQVVCTLRDDAGRLIGVGAVDDVVVPLLGGRRFWLYRQSVVPGVADEVADEADMEMLRHAHAALDEEVDQAEGLCVLVEDPQLMQRRRQAVWPGSGLVHVGFLPTGAQVRVRYFRRSWSSVGDVDLDEGYRIHAFERKGPIPPDHIIQLWKRETAMDDVEARRRIGEVVMVAVDRAGEVVGVATAYRQHNAQLNLDLWYYRTLVANEHRMTNVAVQLTLRTSQHLQDRRSGHAATEPAGVVMEVENDGLKRHLPGGLWVTTGFTYIGTNLRGDHVRVRYFPDALAPPAPTGSIE